MNRPYGVFAVGLYVDLRDGVGTVPHKLTIIHYSLKSRPPYKMESGCNDVCLFYCKVFIEHINNIEVFIVCIAAIKMNIVKI